MNNLPTLEELMDTANRHNLHIACGAHFNPTYRSVCAIGLISFHLDGEAKTIQRQQHESCSDYRQDIADRHNIPVEDLEAVEFAFEDLEFLGFHYRGTPAYNLGVSLRKEIAV